MSRLPPCLGSVRSGNTAGLYTRSGNTAGLYTRSGNTAGLYTRSGNTAGLYTRSGNTAGLYTRSDNTAGLYTRSDNAETFPEVGGQVDVELGQHGANLRKVYMLILSKQLPEKYYSNCKETFQNSRENDYKVLCQSVCTRPYHGCPGLLSSTIVCLHTSCTVLEPLWGSGTCNVTPQPSGRDYTRQPQLSTPHPRSK